MGKPKTLLQLTFVLVAVYSLYNSSKTSSESISKVHLQRNFEISSRKSGYLKYHGEWIRTDYPKVLDVIRRKLLVVPSREPYNLTFGNNYSALDFFKTAKGEPWVDVAIIMETLLPKGQPRVFLECGANEGEIGSNTLYLERYRNWTGLLIEADPVYFEVMKSKHRKAVQINACASPHGNASVLSLHHSPFDYHIKTPETDITALNPGRGYLVGYNDENFDGDPRWFYIDVLCLPIYQIMLATNMTSFDFVVLDAERSELSILQTIPFDKVEMKFILVEMVGKEYQEKIISLLAEKNFTLHSFYAGNSHPENGLFVRNDFYDVTKLNKKYSVEEMYELIVGGKDFHDLSVEDRLGLYSVLGYSSEMVKNENGTNSLTDSFTDL